MSELEIKLLQTQEREEEVVALLKIARAKVVSAKKEIINLKSKLRRVEKEYKYMEISNRRLQENGRHYHVVIDNHIQQVKDLKNQIKRKTRQDKSR
jgi:hypothetical protein